MATLFNYRLLAVGFLQCVFIILYTAVISFSLPLHWFNLILSLAENLPLITATLIMMALESER